ncbi:MAG: phosphoglycerate dehydrogenase [Planctomycetota bacterium]|nr:phosphoglycerate dehydrogenase [Planctomycetota bacterium]
MSSEAPAQAWKILITDPIPEGCIDTLRSEKRIRVENHPGITSDELLTAIRSCHGLIVRSGATISASILEAAPDLEVIVRAGTGVDNIDLPSATARGIVVMNTPGGNTISAAEHTICLMLSLSRNIPRAAASVRAGEWDRGRFVGVEVAGKTLGIVGMGRVGRAVASRARGLEMEVVGFDPYLSEDVIAEMKVTPVSFERMLETADYLTFHVPLTERTRNMLGKAELQRCRRGIRIVNCARGGLIDEAALEEAIDEGIVSGAALDVFETEPPRNRSLLAREEVIATPHLGASTVEALDNVGEAAARQLLDYFTRQVIRGAVNTVDLDARLLSESAPLRDLAKRLGSVQGQVMGEGLDQIAISFLGEALDASVQEILALSFLQGFFEHSLDAPVNLVNARHIAHEKGVRVTQSTGPRSRGYSFLIDTRVAGKEGEHVLSGSLFGDESGRIVGFDGFDIEARPEGWMLLMASRDAAGMIGRMGSIIGDGGVNIANLSLGRDESGGRAVSIFNIDSAAPPDVLDGLKGLDGVLWVRQVQV